MARSRKNRAKIFLVDDHPAVRQGLTVLLSRKNHTICGEAADGQETFSLLDKAKPDLMILDLSLAEESGLALMEELKARGIRIVVYSMHEDAGVIERAFGLGAGAYVTKRDNVSSLMDAVEEACVGGQYVSPIAARILSKSPISGKRSECVSLLSKREKQIMHLVGRGGTNEEIAAELGITVRTLESYFARIIEKLGFDGMKALRRHAIEKKSVYQL